MSRKTTTRTTTKVTATDKAAIRSALRRITTEQILAAFDRFVGSPAYDSAADPSDRNGTILLSGFMDIVVDTGINWFRSWSPSAIRQVLLAFCTHAPDADLRSMHHAAKSQLVWLDEFERDPLGEVRGYSLIDGRVQPRVQPSTPAGVAS